MRDNLHEIPKETLTIENIKKDIKEVHKLNIIPVLLLLFFSWIVFICAKEFWDEIKIMAIFLGVVGVAGVTGSVLMLFMPLIGRKITSKKLVIVEDWLVDIREKLEINPGRYNRNRLYYQFAFAKGSKHRLYQDVYEVDNYKWSKLYNMSNQGIYNYSQVDDEFYLVFTNEKRKICS